MSKKTKEEINEQTGEVTGGDVAELMEENALTVADDVATASLDLMDDLVDAGFNVVKTIKAGNPSSGCVAAYCGIVLAKGAPVTAKLVVQGKEMKNDIETFAVHPAIPRKNVDGSITLTPNLNVTVRLITPNQLAGDLDSLLTKSNHLGKSGFFAFRWKGKKDIKGGSQQLNDFDFIEYLGDKNSGEPVTMRGSAQAA